MGIRPSAKAEYSLSVIPFSHDIVFADLDRLISGVTALRSQAGQAEAAASEGSGPDAANCMFLGSL